jgi:hypothetical protein
VHCESLERVSGWGRSLSRDDENQIHTVHTVSSPIAVNQRFLCGECSRCVIPVFLLQQASLSGPWLADAHALLAEEVVVGNHPSVDQTLCEKPQPFLPNAVSSHTLSAVDSFKNQAE